MLKNYLKIALRNLWRHKTFTVINITGLAVAFGAAILLSFTAFHELSFDSFHRNRSSIYQLYREIHHPGQTEEVTSFPVPFTIALKAEYPDIVHASRYGDDGGSAIRYKDREFNYSIRAVDPDFLQMFDFNLEEGTAASALNGMGNVVITREVAKNLFGTEEAMGRTVQINLDGQYEPFIVSGVTRDVPLNSSLEFTALIRFDRLPGYQRHLQKWDHNDHEVFIQLAPGTTAQAFEQKILPFIHNHYDSTLAQLKLDGAPADKDGERFRIRTIPMSGVHYSTISSFGSISRFYPYLLLLIGTFILLIAAVNFINLSLSRAFTRAREIGIRKVMGAMRGQVLAQFWGEALIICLLSLIVGILLARLAMPGYQAIFHQRLATNIATSPWFLSFVALAFILVSLIAGGYPAWSLSSIKTSQSVKGKLSIGGHSRLRNSLMTLQFVISGMLIICTGIVWQQVNFLQHMPLGYNKEQVISIPIGSYIEGEKALGLMRMKLASVPGVISVTGTDINLGRGRDGSSSTSQVTFEYKGKTVRTNWLRVDYDYAKTLDLQMIKGRDFSRDFATDSISVVINEQMAAALGVKNPVDSLLDVGGTDKFRIVGIVKDYNFKSLHKTIAPLTMLISHDMPMAYIFVKVAPADLAGAMNQVTEVWKSINPKAESAPSFLDENTDNQYQKEKRLSRIFIIGAILAIIISCMGLFAIVILVLNQRTKEIGIRKVLGASLINILTLVSKEFLGQVVIATLIASPVAWYLMHQWLQDFAYRVPITVWIFLASALTALLIALVTISVQVWRTTRQNPVESLKAD